MAPSRLAGAREGFAYDLYAEAQLHDGVLDLDRYKVLILSIHLEYWTRETYFAVKRWLFERGGRLMYLAGNGINCEVTLHPDGSMRCLSHVNAAVFSAGSITWVPALFTGPHVARITRNVLKRFLA
jgi:hypothetical protein